MKYFIRSPNGFGCIKKLKGNRYRPYLFAITVDGKQKPVAYFTNYKDACVYRAEYIFKNKQLDHVREVYPSNNKIQEISPPILAKTPMPTFKEIYLEWLPQHKQRNNVSNSTICGYANALRHCETIKDMPINTIKYNNLQAILDNIGQEKLSYSTKKKVRNLMSLVFQYARARDLIDKDYIDLLDIGKNNPVRPHKPFTENEINLLWDNVDNIFVDKVIILLYTGMRVSELLNLKKSDVNIEERYMHITKSKTKAGLRYVPIHKRILPLVKENLNNKGDYLLINSNTEKKYNYSSFCIAWRKVMEKFKLKHTTHDCRHTLATRLDNVNANEIAKRRILGHAQQTVTEGYTHKNLQELIKTIDLIE